MDNQRLAVISIIVEDEDAVKDVNALLHEYRTYIIGRMGLPIPARNMAVICITMDAPMDAVSALSGKLGALPGARSKTVYSTPVEAIEG